MQAMSYVRDSLTTGKATAAQAGVSHGCSKQARIGTTNAKHIARFWLIGHMLVQHIHQPCPILDRPSWLWSCGCQHHGMLPSAEDTSIVTNQDLRVRSYLLDMQPCLLQTASLNR